MQNGEQTVATRLKTLRNRWGWSQSDLARRSAVSNSTISRIESGDIESPGYDILRKLSGALRVDLSDLGGDGPLPSRPPEVVGGGVRLAVETIRVHAGRPPAWSDTGEDFWVPIRFHDLYPKAKIAIVDGDCMSPHIRQGDKVVFEPDRVPVNGQMVVVATEQGQTLLRWYRIDERGLPFLRSADGEVSRPNGARIMGVVIEFHGQAIRDPEA